MKLSMRTTWRGLAAAAGLALGLHAPAFADTWPSKPVKLIVTFVPGGGADIIGRYVAKHLGDLLGQPVIVENKPGAGGLIGVQAGLAAPADGYTFVLISSSYTVNPSLYKLKFDPVNDITPVVQVSKGPLLVRSPKARCWWSPTPSCPPPTSRSWSRWARRSRAP
jgi:tripartite-type tricarboxylate transporter receptor subunit TctC